MTDRDALLAAVVDRPAEDTPRLMYADQVDEFPVEPWDRDHAALIRAQVALSRAGYTGSGAGRLGLWAESMEELAVIEGWSRTWLAPARDALHPRAVMRLRRGSGHYVVAGAAAFRPAYVGWRRGFPGHVRVCRDDFDAAVTIARLYPTLNLVSFVDMARTTVQVLRDADPDRPVATRGLTVSWYDNVPDIIGYPGGFPEWEKVYGRLLPPSRRCDEAADFQRRALGSAGHRVVLLAGDARDGAVEEVLWEKEAGASHATVQRALDHFHVAHPDRWLAAEHNGVWWAHPAYVRQGRYAWRMPDWAAHEVSLAAAADLEGKALAREAAAAAKRAAALAKKTRRQRGRKRNPGDLIADQPDAIGGLFAAADPETGPDEDFGPPDRDPDADGPTPPDAETFGF